MAEQLNIFIENKIGRLRSVTKILRDNRINIRALVIQDRGDFGIMKILVNDPVRARQALIDNGYAVALKNVLAIAIRDQAGGLDDLLDVFARNQINLIDAYGFVIESSRQAAWCVEVSEPAECMKIITSHGYKTLTDTELYEL